MEIAVKGAGNRNNQINRKENGYTLRNLAGNSLTIDRLLATLYCYFFLPGHLLKLMANPS